MSNTVDPFKIKGPAVISFSGGRTSAYMLWRVLQAHGGVLPQDVHVVFANTGKEFEKTLTFVNNCAKHWGCIIAWVEWRRAKPYFEIVTHTSASRDGEPFAALIDAKQTIPDPLKRFCSEDLKVRTIERFMKAHLYKSWLNVVGLRYDEGHRVMKALAKNDEKKRAWQTVMPLSKAKVTKRDVMEFWGRQPFDLELLGYESNCDLCFLKRPSFQTPLIRDNPGIEDWWAAQEKKTGRTFVAGRPVKQFAENVRSQVELPFEHVADEEHDAECGLTCAAE